MMELYKIGFDFLGYSSNSSRKQTCRDILGHFSYLMEMNDVCIIRIPHWDDVNEYTKQIIFSRSKRHT